ncbi:butyrophilin subfamily 1 member A1-like isoform X1 [Macrotis lagotis]|uniref:butyrophilin subfamily 1 member A1-like isoform X1 n=1 Tax=Macrotis lagotis TaxID=92651 RepID=UPI003D680EA6
MESPSSSVCFLSSYLITFVLFLKLPALTSGQFSVIGPTGPIQASLGGEAELPCYLYPPQSAQHMEVIWLQSARVVHLFRDGEDHFEDQDPNYQGRTELVRDAITSGNVTLKIRDVKLLDAGKYKCLVEDTFYQEEADMELKILGEEHESQISPQRNIRFFIHFGSVMSLYLVTLLLLFSVYFLRSGSWIGAIVQIFILTSVFEIWMCICIFWMQHRCTGLLYKTAKWKNIVSVAIFLILLSARLILLVVIEKRRHLHSRQTGNSSQQSSEGHLTSWLNKCLLP